MKLELSTFSDLKLPLKFGVNYILICYIQKEISTLKYQVLINSV